MKFKSLRHYDVERKILSLIFYSINNKSILLWYYLLISYDLNVSHEEKLYDMYGFKIILNNVKKIC